MKFKKNERLILLIIRYAPSLLVFILSLFVTFFLSYNHNIKLEKNKNDIQKEQISTNKDIVRVTVNSLNEYIKNEDNKEQDISKEKLRRQVHILYESMYSIYNKYKNKKTKEEIVEIIKTSLKYIKFNYSRGYFFINDLNGTNIFHQSDPNRIGNNYLEFRNKNGIYRNKESINIVNQSIEGFIGDDNEKSSLEYNKIGYVKKFEPYNWYIGIDEFIIDIKENTKLRILDYIRTIKLENDGYIFVIDKNGSILASKDRAYDSKNIYTNKNLENIKNEFKEFYEENSYEKYIGLERIYYLKKNNSFEWIIAGSFNINYIKENISEIQKDLDKAYQKDIYTLFFTSILLTFLLLTVSFYLSKRIERRFLDYENSIKNKNLKLLKVHDVAKIGEYELDLKTKKAYWSDKIVEIFGVEKNLEYGPDYLKQIMYDEDWWCFESSLKRCLENDTEHRCEYRVKRPIDGKTVWVECKGKLTDNKNILIGTVQDISDRKQMELEAKKREKLLFQQSKLATMGEMLANIAHQWRQPLSLITSASTGMKVQKELNLLDDKQIDKSLDAINNSAQYLSQTIDDFSNFFKPNENKFTEVSTSLIIQKTLKLVELRIKSYNIELVEDINKITVLTLENELVQVLINIINNSIDELSKSTGSSIILIKTYKKENNLVIEILDNGRGVDEDIKDRIFEPYFTTKHQSQGTGIGLYMSHEIVTKLLDGNLYVENESFIYDNKEYFGAKLTIELKI